MPLTNDTGSVSFDTADSVDLLAGAETYRAGYTVDAEELVIRRAKTVTLSYPAHTNAISQVEGAEVTRPVEYDGDALACYRSDKVDQNDYCQTIYRSGCIQTVSIQAQEGMTDGTHSAESGLVRLLAKAENGYIFEIPVSVGEVTWSNMLGVYVDGVPVTVANCDDVLGDGKASYDPDTNTLTLKNAVIRTAAI